MRRYLKQRGGALWNLFVIIFIVMVVAAVLFPFFARPHESRREFCLNNMKELVLAVQLYAEDHHGCLPSSAVISGKTWEPKSYLRFATQKGTFPPQKMMKSDTWAMLLYPYTKNKDIFWCPSDPEAPNGKTVSYIWKAAIDRATFNGCRTMDDFSHQSDQIVLYERAGWHWGDAAKGLSSGVTLNMTFMDGHVASKRLRDAGNAVGKSDPLAPGEPGWFNCDMTKTPPASMGVGVNYDAGKQGDVLR